MEAAQNRWSWHPATSVADDDDDGLVFLISFCIRNLDSYQALPIKKSEETRRQEYKSVRRSNK